MPGTKPRSGPARPLNSARGQGRPLRLETIDDYWFEQPLQVGDRLVFLDEAIDSLVMTNTCYGVKPASIYFGKIGTLKLVKRFDYEDFKEQLP